MTSDAGPSVNRSTERGSTANRWPVVGDRRTAATVGTVILGYVVVALLDQFLASIGSNLRLVPGVVIALGLLLGPVVAWGVAFGLVVTDIVTGALALDTVVGFLSMFAFVAVAVRLWGSFGVASTVESPGAVSVANAAEYGLVAVTTVIVVVAATAWGYLILGASPFPAAIASTLPSHLLSVLVVGPVVLYSISSIIDRRAFTLARFMSPARGRTDDRRWGVWLLVVGVGWCVSGYAIGTVFHAVDLEYPHILVNQLGRWVQPVIDLAGPGGIYVQVVVGIAFLGAGLWAVGNA